MSNLKIQNLKTDSLIPYARNAKKHDDAQVALIAGSIREFGFNVPVAVRGEPPTIVAGHGRVLAARKLGLAEVPCVRLDHLSDVQMRAYILADNKLAEKGGGWDVEMLRLEVEELAELDVDLGDLGFDSDLEELGKEKDGEGYEKAEGIDETYTKKIIAPIYEPKGECPPITDIFDRSKTIDLVNEIKKSGINKDLADFLIEAAQRHTVFHFARIAEFYCHQDPKTQCLMERSGLVIIDIEKAIENGFVHMTERLGKLADLEEQSPQAEDDDNA